MTIRLPLSAESAPSQLPDLPLMCLRKAESTSTTEAFHGKNTVIDFWTTKCTNCPDALDKLNELAGIPKYADVSFASICCDKLDGAREILEKDDTVRWENISHYFMDEEHKEEAKKILGFKTVPFYVVLDENAKIVQLGSPKQVDLNIVPGAVNEEESKESTEDQTIVVERAFIMDDDF